MKLEKTNNILTLHIDDARDIAFREEWVDRLNEIPLEGVGEYIHSAMYPVFTEREKKIWNGSKINNNELLNAVHLYKMCCND